MKMSIIIALFFLAYIANSQDFEPTQAKFNWGIGGNETYLSADSAYFKQDKFLRGWHWGGSQKISKALDMNKYDAEHYQDETYMNKDVYSILKPEHIWTHFNRTDILNTKAVVFEPTFRKWESGILKKFNLF